LRSDNTHLEKKVVIETISLFKEDLLGQYLDNEHFERQHASLYIQPVKRKALMIDFGHKKIDNENDK
jgi:hypothetical protein